MSYSRNFGFRSFENIVRDARFRTPTNATLRIGAPVTVDPDNPGFLMLAADGAEPDGLSGVVVYEHITQAGIGGFTGVDMNLFSVNDGPFTMVPPGKYAQLVHGVGTKVWYKNTVDRPLYDGRKIDGVTFVAGLTATPTIALKDYLCPDGAGGWREASGTDGKWLQVEQVDGEGLVVEARFVF